MYLLQGGGVMRGGETKNMDVICVEEIKNNNNTLKPKILFLAWASNDNKDYITSFKKTYTLLGTRVISLLIQNISNFKQILEKVDAIYIGGGDALLLQTIIENNNLTRNLVRFAEKKVIIGLSAGAIVLGKKYLNMQRVDNEWHGFKVHKGLNILPYFITSHHQQSFENLNTTKFKQLYLHEKQLVKLSTDLSKVIILCET